jgi:hypothetical protein
MGSHGKVAGINLNDVPEARIAKTRDEGGLSRHPIILRSNSNPIASPLETRLGQTNISPGNNTSPKLLDCFITLFLRSPSQGVFSEGSGEETCLLALSAK